VVPYTPEEALSLFTEAHLTESQYKKFEESKNKALQHLPNLP
jgi:hypothetical protein